MWAMSMDMSRDECIKCLRCLELDAYGNMVSVLRAQGPFTEDKKRLLEELAKVLHISNERHRAEVRRAVNDEKFSFIAEQLNGPNTWTDWAIEGRRAIPLLPRLEARTAFTELANSLSLVIAAANEKIATVNERNSESIPNVNKIVKSEADSYKELNVVENLPPKSLSSNVVRSTRGRKRKRMPEITDTTVNMKLYATSKVNKVDDNDEINSQQHNLPSLLPNNYSKISDIESFAQMETTSGNSIDEVSSINDNTCAVTLDSKYRNNSTNLNCLNNNSETIPHTNITAIDVKLNTSVQSDRLHVLNSNFLKTDDSNEHIINNKLDCTNTEIWENTHISSIAKIDKLPNNVKQLTTVNTIDKVVSSGPGPPTENTSVVTYKKLPLEDFNHQSLTKEINVNSNKVAGVNNFSNAKFNTKGNVIVIQKVPTQSVKISRAGKEVLGKVIIDNKNVCLNKSEATSITLSSSNNVDQTINLVPRLSVNSSHVDVVKSNVNSSNIVLLDMQEVVPEESKLLSTPDKNSDMRINSNTKTVSSDSDTDHLAEDSNAGRLCPPTKNLDINFTERNTDSDENEQISDASRNEGLGNRHCFDNREKEKTPYEEILMIADSEDEESQDVLDCQTQIYNFEANDNICEIQIEETIPDANVQVFSSPPDSSNINLENFNYVETEEETVIMQETGGDLMSTLVDELNELNSTE